MIATLCLDGLPEDILGSFGKLQESPECPTLFALHQGASATHHAVIEKVNSINQLSSFHTNRFGPMGI
jgi:hypothetical protein